METTRGAPILPILIAIAAGLVVLGSTGPWARIGIFTKDGADGDGMLSLIAGVIALVCAIILFTRRNAWLTLLSLVAFSGCLAIGIYDWKDVTTPSTSGQFTFEVEVGWGLVLMTLAAGCGTFFSLLRLVPRRNPSEAATAGS
jgi:hypothetical protein